MSFETWRTDGYKARAEAAEAELERVLATLPSVTYMDPPDGGSPSVSEQVQRMAADARRYRWLRRDGGWWQATVFHAHVEDALDAAIDAELAKEPKP